MGVAAAEAERVDRGAPRGPARRPRIRGLPQLQAAAVQGINGMGQANRRRRWTLRVLEGPEQLQHAGRAAGGDEVPQLRLERADRHLVRVAENGAHAENLLAVAHQCAGGMTLEQLDIGRRQCGAVVGPADGTLLPDGGRMQQARPAAIIAEPYPADDAVDAVAGEDGVIEALEHQRGGALGGQQAIGLGAERGTAACAAQG